MNFKCQKKVTPVLVGIGASSIISLPVLSNVPSSDNHFLSEALCLKVFKNVVKKERSGNLNVSDEEKTILLLCRSKFDTSPNFNARIPTASQCVTLVQKNFQEELRKLIELNVAEAQSLQRCPEAIEVYSIPSGSMTPKLQINDRVIVDKTAYFTRQLRRGDIVLFQPTETLRNEGYKNNFIKRVIGLPGETIAIKNGSVYINNKPVKEDYIGIKQRSDYKYGPAVIPKDSYFVLGDDRNNSYDSHYWGFVPGSLIVGKVIWRYYPLERAGSLSQSQCPDL